MTGRQLPKFVFFQHHGRRLAFDEIGQLGAECRWEQLAATLGLCPIPNMTAGTYLMGVKDKNNCLVTQSVVVGGALRSASERDAILTDIQIQVGPNPTSSKLAVWIGAGLADTKGEWSVSDMSEN